MGNSTSIPLRKWVLCPRVERCHRTAIPSQELPIPPAYCLPPHCLHRNRSYQYLPPTACHLNAYTETGVTNTSRLLPAASLPTQKQELPIPPAYCLLPHCLHRNRSYQYLPPTASCLTAYTETGVTNTSRLLPATSMPTQKQELPIPPTYCQPPHCLHRNRSYQYLPPTASRLIVYTETGVTNTSRLLPAASLPTQKQELPIPPAYCLPPHCLHRNRSYQYLPPTASRLIAYTETGVTNTSRLLPAASLPTQKQELPIPPAYCQPPHCLHRNRSYQYLPPTASRLIAYTETGVTNTSRLLPAASLSTQKQELPIPPAYCLPPQCLHRNRSYQYLPPTAYCLTVYTETGVTNTSRLLPAASMPTQKQELPIPPAYCQPPHCLHRNRSYQYLPPTACRLNAYTETGVTNTSRLLPAASLPTQKQELPIPPAYCLPPHCLHRNRSYQYLPPTASRLTVYTETGVTNTSRLLPAASLPTQKQELPIPPAYCLLPHCLHRNRSYQYLPPTACRLIAYTETGVTNTSRLLPAASMPTQKQELPIPPAYCQPPHCLHRNRSYQYLPHTASRLTVYTETGVTNTSRLLSAASLPTQKQELPIPPAYCQPPHCLHRNRSYQYLPPTACRLNAYTETGVTNTSRLLPAASLSTQKQELPIPPAYCQPPHCLHRNRSYQYLPPTASRLTAYTETGVTNTSRLLPAASLPTQKQELPIPPAYCLPPHCLHRNRSYQYLPHTACRLIAYTETGVTNTSRILPAASLPTQKQELPIPPAYCLPPHCLHRNRSYQYLPHTACHPTVYTETGVTNTSRLLPATSLPTQKQELPIPPAYCLPPHCLHRNRSYQYLPHTASRLTAYTETGVTNTSRLLPAASLPTQKQELPIPPAYCQPPHCLHRNRSYQYLPPTACRLTVYIETGVTNTSRLLPAASLPTQKQELPIPPAYCLPPHCLHRNRSYQYLPPTVCRLIAYTETGVTNTSRLLPAASLPTQKQELPIPPAYCLPPHCLHRNRSYQYLPPTACRLIAYTETGVTNTSHLLPAASLSTQKQELPIPPAYCLPPHCLHRNRSYQYLPPTACCLIAYTEIGVTNTSRLLPAASLPTQKHELPIPPAYCLLPHCLHRNRSYQYLPPTACRLIVYTETGVTNTSRLLPAASLST